MQAIIGGVSKSRQLRLGPVALREIRRYQKYQASHGYSQTPFQ
jgi:hypothetical protein